MNLPRTAVALYVALALHALLGLVLALRPAPQLPEGRAIGLVASPVALSPTEQALLTRSAPWPTDPATDTPSATTPGDALAARSIPQSRPKVQQASVPRSRPQPEPATAPEPRLPLPLALTRTEAPISAGTNTAVPAPEYRVVRSLDSPAPGPAPTPEARPSPRSAQQVVNGRAIAIDAASATASDPGGGMDAYLVRLRRHLAAHRQPLTWSGPSAVASVEVWIDADGTPLEVRLATPSGVADLDREAMDLPERATPLPRPPRGQAIRIRIPVRISVHSAAESP